MAEHAPSALVWLGSRVRPDLGGTLSGIVGDSAHTYGYHRGRYFVSGGDYSVQLSEDRRGSGEAASAIDMSFDPGRMKLYTSRLKAAADRNDPRLKNIREFYGTLNGSNVYGRTHAGSGDATWEFASSDSSHLWHIHISILRQYSNDTQTMRDLLDVLLGKPAHKKGKAFMFLIREKITGKVYVSNGVTRRYIPSMWSLGMLQGKMAEMGLPTTILTVENEGNINNIAGEVI